MQAIVDVVAARDGHEPGVFVVGGTVRDILLGEEGADIDLAVEGDAIAFAYVLADALGGRVTPHPKFGTAIVSYAAGERIDVVTTRRESYASPGALPTVEHAELAHDLHRRDFTMNAMAASLAPDDLGSLFDPYGGRVDLENGAVRVLHDGSFVDDPTRILRGITYEARYGFRFDEHTEALARSCIGSGHVGDLSSSRLRDELVALLDDPGAPDGIRRLGELGVDAAIHPQLRGDDEARCAVRTRSRAAGRARARRAVVASRIGGTRAGDDGRRVLGLARPAQGRPQARRPDRRHGRLGAPNRGAAPLRATRPRAASWRSRIRSHRTRHSSRSRWRNGESCATTSSGFETCVSRSAVRISSRWACPNRRRSGRFSPRSGGGSSTASWAGAKRSSRRHVSSSPRARRRDDRKCGRDRGALRARSRRGRPRA